jgi:hypothetical protein
MSLPALATVIAATCQSAPAPVMTATPPPRLPQPMSEPAARVASPAAGSVLVAPPDTALEERVTLDTHGREVDVRQVLDFLASRAGVRLVYSPDITKRVRLTLIDVPLSQAIQTVLSVAGLMLEGSGIPGRMPPTPAVVFYDLPVNVDSLSVASIMKRFGVGRSVAELLVQGRARP